MGSSLKASVTGNVGNSQWKEGANGRFFSFSVAHNNKKAKEALWVNCVWKDAPSKLAEYIRKGALVTADGHLAVEMYESDNGPKLSVRLFVTNVDLVLPPKDGFEQASARKVVEEDEIPF